LRTGSPETSTTSLRIAKYSPLQTIADEFLRKIQETWVRPPTITEIQEKAKLPENDGKRIAIGWSFMSLGMNLIIEL
jgi:hypothetical protein